MKIKNLRERQEHQRDCILKSLKYVVTFKTKPYRILREYYFLEDDCVAGVDKYSRRYFKYQKQKDIHSKKKLYYFLLEKFFEKMGDCEFRGEWIHQHYSECKNPSNKSGRCDEHNCPKISKEEIDNFKEVTVYDRKNKK